MRKWLAGNHLESSELESIKLDNWREEIKKIFP